MTNNTLVKKLIDDGYLKSQSVIEAFSHIDRADFVLPEDKENAYADMPLSIGHGQTISQPLTVAFMLELLTPKKGDRVLDVGAGSGWQTALLAHICGVDSSEKSNNAPFVAAIERIPELAKMAEQNISKYGFMENCSVMVVNGDGARGFPEMAPFDCIICAASAPEIMTAWKEQLKVGGRIVAPLENSIVLLEKTGADSFERKEFFGFSFVPLVSEMV